MRRQRYEVHGEPTTVLYCLYLFSVSMQNKDVKKLLVSHPFPILLVSGLMSWIFILRRKFTLEGCVIVGTKPSNSTAQLCACPDGESLWFLLKWQGEVSDTKEAISEIKEDIYAIVANLFFLYKQSSPYEQSF